MEPPVKKNSELRSFTSALSNSSKIKNNFQVIRPHTPILIGKRVVRIHVKKWQQLCNIEQALEDIERANVPEKED